MKSESKSSLTKFHWWVVCFVFGIWLFEYESSPSLTRLSISLVGIGSASLNFLVNLFTPHSSNTVLDKKVCPLIYV